MQVILVAHVLVPMQNHKEHDHKEWSINRTDGETELLTEENEI